MTVGIDLGALTVTVASGDGVTNITAPADGPRAGMRAALAAARPRGELCLAVPDPRPLGYEQHDACLRCVWRARASHATWTSIRWTSQVSRRVSPVLRGLVSKCVSETGR
jgi:hypothetical protein